MWFCVEGLGAVNTVPDANNAALTLKNLPKGREECFDQYTLNYANRNTGIIDFKDDVTGKTEMKALHGSGEVFNGRPGKNVLFRYSVNRSKYCLYSKYIHNVTNMN